MRLAIYGNKYQEGHIEGLSRFFNALANCDVQVAMEYTFYNYLCRVLPSPPRVEDIIKGDNFSADLAISIGGDGTFLRTAQWVGSKNIPIMGINTGHLGYLADVQISESETIIDDIISANYKIEERSLIEVESTNGFMEKWPFALNEVAVLKQDTASMIYIKTEINDIELNTYIGDGLIISTPTGSTGYNLSVGGPIIEPTAPNWAISPIAAHSLTVRPLVISNESVIKITTSSRSTSYRLSLDGRSISLPEGTSIILRKAPFSIKVAQRPNHHFTDTLRNKLLWGIDKR